MKLTTLTWSAAEGQRLGARTGSAACPVLTLPLKKATEGSSPCLWHVKLAQQASQAVLLEQGEQEKARCSVTEAAAQGASSSTRWLLHLPTDGTT